MLVLKLPSIIKGWFFSKIWAPCQAKIRSRGRLKECIKCDNAIDSSVLKFINGEAEQVKVKKCAKPVGCGCPIVEKSLVKSETCPLKKW